MAAYAIDIHGTLSVRSPEGGCVPSPMFPLLKGLMEAWVQQGDRVAILSGPTADVIYEELERLGLVHGVHYHAVFSVVDFLRRSGEPMWEDPPESGRWWAAPEAWNAAKGRLAEKLGITVVVDDTEAYRAAMPPSVSFVHLGSGRALRG